MSDDLKNATVSVSGDSVNVSEPPAEPQSGQKGSEQVDWETKYKQQQSSVQQKTEAFNSQVTLLQTQRDQALGRVADLQDELKKATGDLATAQATVSDFSVQLEELAKTKGELETKAERWALIAGEFPQLVQFETQGLLPNADIAELRGTLEAFQTNLKALTTSSNQNIGQGASPSAPPQTPGYSQMSKDTLWEKAIEANRKGQTDEYERIMELMEKL